MTQSVKHAVEWYAELPEITRVRATVYHMQHFQHFGLHHDDDDIEDLAVFDSLSAAVAGGFAWSDTAETDDFWAEVRRSSALRDLAERESNLYYLETRLKTLGRKCRHGRKEFTDEEARAIANTHEAQVKDYYKHKMHELLKNEGGTL